LKGIVEGQCQGLRIGTRKVGRSTIVGKWRVEKRVFDLEGKKRIGQRQSGC